MSKKNVVLVTGVAGAWGRQVAARLLLGAGDTDGSSQKDSGAFHVIGLDMETPQPEIKALDFVQANIHNAFLVELLKSEEVQTVCHLAFDESMHPGEATFESNVMGTMKVLAACTEAGVKKVVLKSSTAVYGALPGNPAFLTEEQPVQGSRSYGYTRDLVEIEAFCNGFRRQAPEMILTILRFPGIIGPTADTPLTRYLKQPLIPVLLGFDPMMQVIHERDVVEALVQAIMNDYPGVINVADEGVMPLTKLIGLAGKLPLPLLHPLAYWGVGLLGGSNLRLKRYAPIELDYIRYSWVADLTRMRTEFNFTPRYLAEEALREFAARQRLSRYAPESASLAADEERLRETIERRRRMRVRREEAAQASLQVEKTEDRFLSPAGEDEGYD